MKLISVLYIIWCFTIINNTKFLDFIIKSRWFVPEMWDIIFIIKKIMNLKIIYKAWN